MLYVYDQIGKSVKPADVTTMCVSFLTFFFFAVTSLGYQTLSFIPKSSIEMTGGGKNLKI
jgi:flagellar biosynthesis protein FliQ